MESKSPVEGSAHEAIMFAVALLIDKMIGALPETFRMAEKRSTSPAGFQYRVELEGYNSADHTCSVYLTGSLLAPSSQVEVTVSYEDAIGRSIFLSEKYGLTESMLPAVQLVAGLR